MRKKVRNKMWYPILIMTIVLLGYVRQVRDNGMDVCTSIAVQIILIVTIVRIVQIAIEENDNERRND
jgi:hypothetical protein